MRAEEIIANASLVHSCSIKWSLKSYSCEAYIVKEEPIDDLSYVICSLIDKCNTAKNKISIGIMLGFSLLDDEPNQYYDAAEYALYEDLLKIVAAKHLITVTDDTITLTNLGGISLQEEKIFSFLKTSKPLYEHLLLNCPDDVEMDFFPYFNDMGITSSFGSFVPVWPDDNDVERIIFDDLPALANRLNLLSAEPAHIYDPQISQYFDTKTLLVDVNLYEDSKGFYPVIMNGDKVATKATELLYLPCNELLLENITLECRFKKLWADRSAQLNYSTLEPFFEFVDFDELVKDERIVWEDDQLFHKVADEGSADCWITISKKAPMNVIYAHMDECSDRYDWTQLSSSERADDNYLLEHFASLPWDLDIISNDIYRNIEVIEKLILINKETYEVWDWDALKSRLSKEFVLENLDLVDVDLSSYTENIEAIRTLISKHPNKHWDWNKIESEFDLVFILENIRVFEKYFSFDGLFDRVFTDEDWCSIYATNENFLAAAKCNIDNHGRLASLIFNDKDYVWNDVVIEAFTSLGLLSWATTRYMSGFECNDSLIWNQSFFAKYHDMVATNAGFSYVSKSIMDISLLAMYPSFKWNWDSISGNQRLLSNPELFSKYNENINYLIAISALPSTSIIESLPNICEILGEESKVWSAFSDKVNTDYVKQHQTFPWDWTILTRRMFSKLKPQNLGHPSFVDKWDWSFLSKELPAEFISDNLAKFKEKWDWSTILSRILSHSELMDNSHIASTVGILNSIENQVSRLNAWTAFTKLYNLSELKTISTSYEPITELHWDFALICSLYGFNVFVDFDSFKACIDWDSVSQSEIVGKQLAYNPDMGLREGAWKDEVKKLLSSPGSKWNHAALSHFDSLNSQEWYLTNYQAEVDWEYVSLVSKLFCTTDKQEIHRIVEKFKNSVRFDKLSQRVDVDLNQVVKAFPDRTYDYNTMIANDVFDATADFVSSHDYYSWNWKVLSKLESFIPDADFMTGHYEKDFDWGVLSHRELRDVWSSVPLLKKLATNSIAKENIDWYYLSSNIRFPLNLGLFELLPAEKLDWATISSKKNIDKLIDQYSSYIDWHILSKNPAFKVTDDSVLLKYKELIDWQIICSRQDFVINNIRLETFCDVIDWTQASNSHDLIFTIELVERYKDKWNWPVLVRNSAFNNNVQMRECGYLKQENIISFIDNFSQRPQAFHVTHMSNAVTIIKSGKLQSRNKAEGNFVNSAGSNVYRRGTAHRFARFYYIPKSPTQYHFECLGKVNGMDYYNSYCTLGKPKCPLPVFFIFDVEEALQKFPDKCWYSTGNMQSDSSRVYKVVDDPNHINGRDIYTYPTKENMSARQQEFLVDEEVDLTLLDSLKICCYDDFQTELLLREIKGNALENKVKTGYSYSLFERINKELFLDEEDDYLNVNTNFTEQYEFRIEYGDHVPTIEDSHSSPREKNHNLYLDGAFEIKRDTEFKIYFEVDQPTHRSWLIYTNR